MDDNANADAASVLADTADAVEALLQEHGGVYVHCVRCESRTPAVAAAWLIRHRGLDLPAARQAIRAGFPSARINSSLMAALGHFERSKATAPPEHDWSPTGPITDHIQGYRRGQVAWTELFDYLVSFPYKNPSWSGRVVRDPDDLEDVDRHEPNTWGELEFAYHTGQLSPQEFYAILNAFGLRGDPANVEHLAGPAGSSGALEGWSG